MMVMEVMEDGRLHTFIQHHSARLYILLKYILYYVDEEIVGGLIDMFMMSSNC